jgi:branched-chain amino acid transport system substrate-binding protein
MRTRLYVVTVMALVLSMAAGGCTGGTPKSAAETEIVLGLAAPMTGNLAHIGTQFREGVDLAVEEINAAGGVNGKKLTVLVMDDKGDPKEAANVAQKLASDPKVKAVIGHYSSSACFAGIPIYDKANLTMITPSASHPELTHGSKYAFKMWTSFTVYAPKLADLTVTELGKKNVAVIYVYNDWGIGSKNAFVSRVKQLGGTMVAEEVFYDGDKDFRTQLTKIKSRNPDVLMIYAYYTEGALVVQQARGLGLDVQLIGSGTFYEKEFVRLAGDDAEGMFIVTEFVTDDPRPSVQNFVKKYQAKYPGKEPGNYQGNSYDIVYLLTEAVKKAGTDRAAIRDALAATKDYAGVTGTISFTDEREVVKSQVFLKLENGQWKFHRVAE